MSFPFPAMSQYFWPPYMPVIMSSGGSAQRNAGIPGPHDSLTFPPQNISTISGQDSPDAESDLAARAGVSITGGSGEQLSGIVNQFDDSPYVPPRVIHAEPHSYTPLDLNTQRQQALYEGGTSPADSQHSGGDSVWSTPSSSTSTHALQNEYLAVTSSYPTQPTRPSYYPAYHGQQRLGLEHVRSSEHPQHTGGTYYRPSPQDYSVDSILSSEIFEESAARGAPGNHPTTSQGSSSSSAGQVPNVSTFPVSSALTDTGSSLYPDAGPYLRQQLGLSPHETVNLHTIPDPVPSGEKPSTPLPMLIKLAIYGSQKKQLTLQEIYNELENRFQWFRDHKNDKAWKNSIRHNLSLNKVFKLVSRPITEPGKGSYWQLDVSEGEGYKRPRKRRPKNRTAASEEEDETSEIDEDRPSSSGPSHHSGPARSSTTPIEDSRIDPELRTTEGHVVGEGRSRSTTQRTTARSPYPSQSPRYQQVPLPMLAVQQPTEAQPPVRFGQPSFGPAPFPAFPQTRSLPTTSSSVTFAAMSSSPVIMAPTMSTVSRPHLQLMPLYDRAAPISQPPLRQGIEYVDSRGLPVARGPYPGSQGQPQGNVGHSHSHSPSSSSSGSPQTWSDPRYRSQTDGR